MGLFNRFIDSKVEKTLKRYRKNKNKKISPFSLVRKTKLDFLRKIIKRKQQVRRGKK